MNENFEMIGSESLSVTEKTILEYITGNIKIFYSMSIQELAQNTFTSTSTIMRLCKKLNFSGFNELKYYMCYNNDTRPVYGQEHFALSGIISKHVANLKQTAMEIDIHNIEKTISCFMSEKKIHFFARGLSYMPIFYMYNMLLSVDCNCFIYIDPPIMYYAAEHMDENDVLIIGSSGGRQEAIVKVATAAKEHHAMIIAFLSEKASPLYRLADISYHCIAEQRLYETIDIKSRLSIMFVIDLILECYLEKLHIASSDAGSYVDNKNW